MLYPGRFILIESVKNHLKTFYPAAEKNKTFAYFYLKVRPLDGSGECMRQTSSNIMKER